MALKIIDIAEGRGPECILLVKHEGKYAIFCEGSSINNIHSQIQELKAKIRREKANNKNDSIA